MLKPLVIALAVVAGAPPLLAATRDHLGLVACESRRELFELLNAADRGDTKAEARLTAGACEPIGDLHYKILGGENGVLTIRVFPSKGDWEHSRVAYTLDTMIAAH